MHKLHICKELTARIAACNPKTQGLLFGSYDTQTGEGTVKGFFLHDSLEEMNANILLAQESNMKLSLLGWFAVVSSDLQTKPEALLQFQILGEQYLNILSFKRVGDTKLDTGQLKENALSQTLDAFQRFIGMIISVGWAQQSKAGQILKTSFELYTYKMDRFELMKLQNNLFQLTDIKVTTPVETEEEEADRFLASLNQQGSGSKPTNFIQSTTQKDLSFYDPIQEPTKSEEDQGDSLRKRKLEETEIDLNLPPPKIPKASVALTMGKLRLAQMEIYPGQASEFYLEHKKRENDILTTNEMSIFSSIGPDVLAALDLKRTIPKQEEVVHRLILQNFEFLERYEQSVNECGLLQHCLDVIHQELKDGQNTD